MLSLSFTNIKDFKDVKLDNQVYTGASIRQLYLDGIPFTEDVKNLIMYNIHNIEMLDLSNSGFGSSADNKFFEYNGENMERLTWLNMSNNDMSQVSLGHLKLHTYICRSCNYSNLTGAIDLSQMEYLALEDNKIYGFVAANYPTITDLNLSGNKDLTWESFSSGPNIINLNISNINFGRIEPDLLYKDSIQSLRMSNTGLRNSIDFHGFTNLRRLYLDNVSKEYENSISQLRLDHTSLQELDVTGNSSFSSILLQRETGETVDPTLDSLSTIYARFTNASSLDFSKFAGLINLDVTGSEKLNILKLFEDATNNNYALDNMVWYGIALTNIPTNTIPYAGNIYTHKPADQLYTTKIKVDYSKPRVLQLHAMPKLYSIEAVNKGTFNYVTSLDEVPVSELKSLTPSMIKNADNFNVYEGFTIRKYDDVSILRLASEETPLTTLKAGTEGQVQLVAPYVSIDDVNFSGPVEVYDGNGNPYYEYKNISYFGYYDTNIVKISSDKYVFDETAGVVVVGDAKNNAILSDINLSSSKASKKVTDDNLEITMNNAVVKTYKISHEDPATYKPSEGGSEGSGSGGGDIIDPDKESEKGSLDPTSEQAEQTEKAPETYESTAPTNTGAFISIISLIVLVAAAIVSQYYLKIKRKNEELIEKI